MSTKRKSLRKRLLTKHEVRKEKRKSYRFRKQEYRQYTDDVWEHGYNKAKKKFKERIDNA